MHVNLPYRIVYLPNHTRDFYLFFVPVAYGRGSILFRRGDEIRRGRGNFWGFLPTDNALYIITFGTHTKTAEPIKMLFKTMSGLSTRPVQCVTWGADLRRGRGNFWGKHVPDKPNGPYTGMNFALKDRFHLNLLIYRKVQHRPISCY